MPTKDKVLDSSSKTHDNAEAVLKKYVDELNAQSEQVEIQTGTSNSTLAKYLSAAPKFKKSGVQMGSITTPISSSSIGSENNSGDGVDGKNSGLSEQTSLIYQPKLKTNNNHLNNNNNLNNVNNIERNNNNTPMEKKRKMDDFLDEISNKNTPKKTKKNGYLKISNVRVSSEEMEDEFSRFGDVYQCIGSNNGNVVYLEMKKYDAECAMHAMQRRKFGGEQINIQWCTNNEIEQNFNTEFTEQMTNSLIKMLQNIDTKRNSIMNLMGFCLDNSNHAEAIIDLFIQQVFSTAKKASSPVQKLACIYVFNDLLHNPAHSTNYLSLLQDRMIGILQATLSVNNKETKEKVETILKLWKEKTFFSETKIQGWIDMLS